MTAEGTACNGASGAPKAELEVAKEPVAAATLGERSAEEREGEGVGGPFVFVNGDSDGLSDRGSDLDRTAAEDSPSDEDKQQPSNAGRGRRSRGRRLPLGSNPNDRSDEDPLSDEDDQPPSNAGPDAAAVVDHGAARGELGNSDDVLGVLSAEGQDRAVAESEDGVGAGKGSANFVAELVEQEIAGGEQCGAEALAASGIDHADASADCAAPAMDSEVNGKESTREESGAAYVAELLAHKAATEEQDGADAAVESNGRDDALTHVESSSTALESEGCGEESKGGHSAAEVMEPVELSTDGSGTPMVDGHHDADMSADSCVITTEPASPADEGKQEQVATNVTELVERGAACGEQDDALQTNGHDDVDESADSCTPASEFKANANESKGQQSGQQGGVLTTEAEVSEGMLDASSGDCSAYTCEEPVEEEDVANRYGNAEDNADVSGELEPGVEKEEACRMLKRNPDTEKTRTDANADMSEDFFEGEKGEDAGDPSVAYGDSNTGSSPKTSSVDKLYIVLISLHGLVRGENMELGRDSDTGGQVKYVVELAKALSSSPGVYRVDLLTRQILAPNFDRTYGEPAEMLVSTTLKNSKQERGENSGAYIIRLPFGPKDKYLAKEHLWPFIQEFVDGALSHIVRMSKTIGEEIVCGHPVWPAVIHGHYASAGIAAALLSGALNLPMAFTGHFLGKDKLEGLLKQGRQSREQINMTYKIMCRIEAEELSLDASEIVIASTRQEIEEQWNLYDGFEVILARKLRAIVKRGANCYGRYMPRMVIIPPGVEFGHIIHDFDMDGEEENACPASEDPPIWSQIMRFFTNPRKPMILAVARPYPEKNITTLVKAFGECRPLRELANLTLIMGNREAISKMHNMSAAVLTSVLTLIDEYDLYGQVAYPKHHKHSEVPDIYRLAARTKGAFVNVAYFEQFGVTLIEAAMNGLPIIATKNGAPVEIHQVLDNGLLVDPHDQNAIADALYKLLSDKQLWSRCRENGLKNIHRFSWPEHCKNYLSRILTLGPRSPAIGSKEEQRNAPISGRKHIIVISVDSVNKEDLVRIIRNAIEVTRTEETLGSTGFVLSTSLTISEIRSLLVSAGMLPTDFDAFICNSGSNIYYPSNSGDMPSSSHVTPKIDQHHRSHIEYRWGGEGLRKYLVKWATSVVERKGRIERQIIFEDPERSSTYCLAFKVVNPNHLPPLKELRKLMRMQSLRCNPLYNHSATRLSVIPIHASRSKALRYLCICWGIELPNVVVLVGESGDSDYEELLGGLHKTVILKGEFNIPANRIHTVRRYPLQDVVALDSSNIIEIEDCTTDDMRSALRQIGVLTQ